jgi:hypothetical protein
MAEQGGGPMPQRDMTTAEVGSAIAKATSAPPPTMEESGSVVVELPGGYIGPDKILVREARVRELTGFDEEKLARTDMMKNAAAYITEMLCLGVEELAGEKPSRKVIQSLLIGDRDALMLGIRQATYGDNVEFRLTCPVCDTENMINVVLSEDVPIIPMDDPLKREFEVPLRRGFATVRLLTGVAQEAFSADMSKKTTAEVTTVMLAKSVVAINGKPVGGRTEDVLRMSAADRQTVMDFLAEHQPGPQLNKEIPVPCATCGEEFQILLGIPNLFRW